MRTVEFYCAIGDSLSNTSVSFSYIPSFVKELKQNTMYRRVLRYRNKSMDVFSEKYPERILEKYLVYTKDLNKDKDIMMIPVYMLPFLK